MKKVLTLIAFVIASIYLQAQDSITLVGEYSYEKLNAIEADGYGTLLYTLNEDSGRIEFKNVSYITLLTSEVPVSVYEPGVDFLSGYESTQKVFDQDDNFETVVRVKDGGMFGIEHLYVLDNDGSVLLDVNAGDQMIRDYKILNNTDEYYMLVCIDSIGNQVYHLNNLYPQNPSVDTTVHVEIYDTTTTVIEYVNYDTTFVYDTVTYIQAEYLSTYDEMVISLNEFTGIDPLVETPEILVYPNPTASTVNIDCDYDFDGYNIELVNPSGKVVFTNVLNSSAPLQININELNLGKGLHFLRFNGNGKVITKKLMIQ